MLTTAVEEQRLADEGLKRTVGLLGLAWASEGSIIGSGWLFGALAAASLAGPASIISWIVASIIVILLALVHAELGGAFPVTGGTTRFPHYAYGSVAGATFGWFSYLQAAAVAPIEAIAAVTYMSGTSWGAFLYTTKNRVVSTDGFLVTIGFMAVFVVINLLGIRWFAGTNNAVTTWKVLIPIVTIIIFMGFHFHGGNFSSNGGFFFGGTTHTAAKAVMEAIPKGGIVFALLGFEQAVQIGGESRNPERDLPRAVIGSILLGALIYILVEVAFIGALHPATVVHAHTWAGLAHNSALMKAPFATVASLAGLGWLSWILRFDAVVSPSGTGMVYLTSTSRISFGLSRNGYVPQALEKVTPRTRVPLVSIIVAFVFGLLFLAPFHSWYALVTAVTLASVLMYAGAPLALGALRKSMPDLKRPYILPAGGVLGPAAFVLANFIIYWTGWTTYTAIMAGLLIGLVIMGLSYALKLNPRLPTLDWGAAIWVFPWLIGMGVIIFFGNYSPGGIIGGTGIFKTVWVGGDGAIPIWWDLGTVAVWSLCIYYMAIARRLDTAEVEEYVGTIHTPEAVAH